MKNYKRHGWEFSGVTNKAFFEPKSVLLNEDNKRIDFSVYAGEDDSDGILSKYRRAAVIHRIVRGAAKKMLHADVKYWDVVKSVEDSILEFTKSGDRKSYFSNIGDYQSGMAFPVGFSVDEIVAHDTSFPEDERKLNAGDIVKLDIGVMNDGCIIDSAFTHIVDDDDSIYQPLLDASADATYSAIASSGVDARLYEISETIQEIINSYEIDLNGKTVYISPVRGLGGHNILRNKVHGDKLILCIPHKIQENMKMEEGEIYAIETYASTGYGEITKKGDITHFSFEQDKLDKKGLKKFTKDSKSGIETWLSNRKMLPFSSQWCEEAGIKNPSFYLRKYVGAGIVNAYPPLTDTLHSKTSQFEHTIHIRDTGVEILSLGDDY
jgi:methionyl aminopeptidase